MKAIYPGTFDPITFGHMDVVGRAANMFDEVVIAVYANPKKDPLFTVEERVGLAVEAVKKWPNVRVTSFSDQLMVEFARSSGAKVVIRGLRAISDFDSELSYAQTNRKLAPDLETTFLMTALEYAFLSSTTAKEIARLGGDIGCMVPEHIEQAIRQKIQAERV